MSRFEERRGDLARAWAIRPGDNDVTALGLLTLAEGLSEVIALLRPLAEAGPSVPQCRSEDGGVTCQLGHGHRGVHSNGDEGHYW